MAQTWYWIQYPQDTHDRVTPVAARAAAESRSGARVTACTASTRDEAMDALLSR